MNLQTGMHLMNRFYLLPLLFSLLPLTAALPFDHPTAGLSSQWTNIPFREAREGMVVYYSNDFTVRPILQRGSMGPSFACGFFSTGDAFLFSIFIADVKVVDSSNTSNVHYIDPQVVWSANRDRPVKENATLLLSDDGNLVLRDVDGSTVWSTNTSGRSVAGMNITDIGTLELFDGSNSTVWSSIDHPTDSWVLGQTLREGQRLTANVSATDSAQGQLYLSVVSGGLAAYVGSDPPQPYYTFANASLGNIAQDRATNITFTNGSLSISYYETRSLPAASSVQFMRLDYDGHLRLYELDMIGKGWKLVLDVFNPYLDDCDYPTVCGQYGVCSDGQCSCLAVTGTDSGAFFKQNDEWHPNLGCHPVTPLSCHSNQSHHLLPLRDVYYPPYFEDNNVAQMRGATEESCKEACMRNCSCKAAFFMNVSSASPSWCFLPSQLFSMSYDFQYSSSVFIKVPSPQSDATSRGTEKKKASVSVMVAIIIGSIFVASLLICLIIARARRNKDTELEEEDQLGMVRGIPARFSLDDLKVATENFCRKLGGGGFGSVFEGTLGDGTKVAVKRLEGVGQGNKEFLAEVETIGSIHHINLVRLIGFCAEKSWRLLVYEYMINGSLDQWIFYKGQDRALDWQARRRIITGIAKGLAYLHEGCRQRIAHLDIKPQNILLDEQLNAKVSDFGLSKLIDRDQSQVVTRMRGTPGYLAPEWLTSAITEKADVYSFGVVVMEIICGRKNLDHSQPEEGKHLLSLLQVHAEEDRLSDMVDTRSSDMQQHIGEAIETMKLSMWCLQSDSVKRPPMSVVLKVLEGSMAADSDIDYNFSFPAPSAPHNASNGPSASPSAACLSGPR